MEINVKHTNAKAILLSIGYDMEKLNTGVGDYQALDTLVKQTCPNVIGTEFDFVNDKFIIKYHGDTTVDPNLFAEYGESVEVVEVYA